MNQGRLAAYSAGNKVYGSGRPNPTSGPVDPTGYVERAMKKESSNRRSGLAAAVTRRLQAGSGKPQGAPNVQEPQQAQPPHTPGVAPISLPDGRQIVSTATGQYEWMQQGI